MLSVPSSSGHRFQRLLSVKQPDAALAAFQSPLRRGTGFNEAGSIAHRALRRMLSVPSSSGHRFQLSHDLSTLVDCSKPFQSPLHRGTGFNQAPRSTRYPPTQIPLSVPSSSGHRLQRPSSLVSTPKKPKPYRFQSPLSSGHRFQPHHSLPQSQSPVMSLSVPSSSGHRFQQPLDS